MTEARAGLTAHDAVRVCVSVDQRQTDAKSDESQARSTGDFLSLSKFGVTAAS